jgi:HAD superfamily hydrolase (TIGR01509 family)
VNALIFDVDGVLGDTEWISEQATIKFFQDHHGVTMVPTDFHPFIGTGSARYILGPAEKYGVTVPDIEEAVRIREANFKAIIDSRPNIAFPGANALIAAVHADPAWKLALATSSPGETSKATLGCAGVDTGRFDAWIHGDMVTNKKPDPEIYLTAAKALGLEPRQCVVVEDALTGIAAAKAAGMTCIGITNSFSREQLAQADHIVDSLEAVDLELLRRLAGY